jgi:iron-sulfur cluster assembly protein
MDQTPAESTSGVGLSEAAIERVQHLMAKENCPESGGLRVGVVNGGCSGMSYTLGLDGKPGEADSVFQMGAVKVFVDAESLPYLEGMVVDFADGLHGAGFRFTNPNAERTCGCGTSFAPNE